MTDGKEWDELWEFQVLWVFVWWGIQTDWILFDKFYIWLLTLAKRLLSQNVEESFDEESWIVTLVYSVWSSINTWVEKGESSIGIIQTIKMALNYTGNDYDSVSQYNNVSWQYDWS